MKYIVANWKMNLSVRESVALARGVLRELRGEKDLPQVILCPAFTALHEVYKYLARSRIALGAQNAGPHARAGAYTGEISASMLEDVHCQYVLIGHSECRHLGESDVLIRQKLQAVFASRLTPILCIGETVEEHEQGQTFPAIEMQLQQVMRHLEIPHDKSIIIAYEPVWAIGTGVTPSIGDIVAIHTHIRNLVSAYTGRQNSVILYGGSVSSENAYLLLRESQIDGVLVGGASLKLHAFTDIMKAGIEVMSAQEGH